MLNEQGDRQGSNPRPPLEAQIACVRGRSVPRSEGRKRTLERVDCSTAALWAAKSARRRSTGGAGRAIRFARLTPPAQGGQDVLGAAVLAFRKPLAQLAEDRAWHPVALQPAKQLLLAGGELDALQVSSHLRGQALPQES